MKLPAGMNAISNGSGSKNFFLPCTPVSSPLFFDDPKPDNRAVNIRADRVIFFMILWNL
jgi:hypothetical protein